MRKTNLSIILVLTLLVVAPATQAATYKIDVEHSSVEFKIRHLVAKTKGNFNKFDGIIEYDPAKPKKGEVKATIDIRSIDTNSAKRDEHLKSKDFFDAEKFPTMTFTSTKITKLEGNKGELVGKLTMLGVTKPVILDVEVTGTTTDPWGNERIGFTGKTKINRKDFGMMFNMEGKDGSFVIGDEVEITLEIEGTKKTS